jgi:dnd system-associated protein 4
MTFAAALGFRLDPESAVERLEGFGEGIPFSVFQRAVDDGFIDALAVTLTQDLKVLGPDQADHRLDIFEHFAQIGLLKIQEVCYSRGTDPLSGILDLLDEYQDSADSLDKLPGLEASARRLGQIM